jgi:hypothetical protein
MSLSDSLDGVSTKRSIGRIIIDGIFSYSNIVTQKVKGYGAGAIFRIVQIIILTYIIWFV